MEDKYHRQINYLRISVTDRCNLRCFYCRGVRDFSFIPHEEILSYEEIIRLVRLALMLGIDRFRITGGEPLVRKGVEGLITEINSLSGVKDLSLTTNGVLLNGYLEKLRAAGLKRLNISLDTLNPEKYRKITGGFDGLSLILASIQRALEIGFFPVKLNVVLLKGVNEDEVEDFVRLTFELPLHVRFIELMDFSPVEGYFLSAREVMEKIKKIGQLEPLSVPGSGPARNYHLAGMKGSLGFITPLSNHFCGTCNRLRVSADGQLRTCLFSEKTYDLRKLLRGGAADSEILNFLKKALTEKPGNWQELEARSRKKGLRSIGG
jgi:cyclic pyranopterin phosphate synthase